MTLVKIAEISEIPMGQTKVVKLAEKEVLIANVNNVYYAIGNICRHMHGDFKREGNTVTCPKHKAKFDVTNGKVVSGPKTPFIHPKINDELVYSVMVEEKGYFNEPQ